MSQKIESKEFVLVDSNLQEIFTDGLCAVHNNENIIRMDFMSFQPQMNDSEGRRVCSVKHRVIMTLDNFVEAFNTQQGLITQMIAAGLVQWHGNGPENPAAAKPAADISEEKTDSSEGKKTARAKNSDKQ